MAIISLGVKRRFPLSNSIIPIRDRTGAEYPYDTKNPSVSFVSLVWDEIFEMMDFDGCIQFHNIREQGSYNSTGVYYDRNDPEQIYQGLVDVQKYVKSKTDRGMSILAIPDGNNVYKTAGEKYADVMMMTGNSVFPSTLNLLNFNLNKQGLAIYLNDNFESSKEEFEKKRALMSNTYAPWALYIFHNVDTDFSSSDTRAKLADYIYDNYGENGTDDVWIASPDEIYQYKYCCENTPLKYEVKDGVLSITLDVSFENADFYWHEYTILINGVNYSPGMTVNYSDDVIGMSKCAAWTNGMMLNVNFDKSLLTRAEKYTLKHEASHSDDDKNDALYFVQRLTSEKAASFINRLK